MCYRCVYQNCSHSASLLSLLFLSWKEFRILYQSEKNTHTHTDTNTHQSVASSLSDVELIMVAYRGSPMNSRTHPPHTQPFGLITAVWGGKGKLRDRYVFFRMDRYGFGHAPLLRDTSVIGMEAGSPPPLTDYSYHLVRFHEAIICLHTPPTLGMADYRNTHYTVSDGGKCLSLRKRKVVCLGSSSHQGIKVTV